LHSATIEVDEVGTVAAAATVVRMQARCAVFPMAIKFDKPFIFAIQMNETILFLGRFSSPN
jgi:serine protease inhibitor